jgi:hypothetical protein
MEAFGVSVLFPDFYFQVPQFCEEIISALKELAQGRVYEDSPEIRYGYRLTAWWSGWQPGHTDEEDVEAAYKYLVETLREIRKRLAPARQDVPNSNKELLKLEVWARWEPSDESRGLGLWAVSTGVRRDFTSIHRPDLDSGSSYEAVQALATGAPRLRHLDESAKGKGPSNRWHTYLSVPVRHRDRLGTVPVGVISLVGSRGSGLSRVEVADAVSMQELVDTLADCGRQLLGPAAARMLIETSR